MLSKARFNQFRVEFRDNQTEMSYREWSLDEQLIFFRKVVLIGIAATMIFIIPDLLKIGWKIELLYSLLSRLFFSVLVYALLKYLEHKKNARLFHNVLFFICMGVTINTSTVVIIMGNHTVISALSEIIAIQVFYVIFPQRFLRALTVAIPASVLLVVIHLYIGQIDSSSAGAIVMAFILANLFGIIYNRDMNRYQRLQYANLLFEQRMNVRLDKEIKQREKLQADLLEMTRTDPLTGLFNRRYFVSQLDLLIYDSDRYHTPFSLLTLDIDFFKLINDQYGHQVGDQVLIQFSHTIKKLLRKSDLLARVGGEEFVVLVPNTKKEAAVTLGEKIRKSVEEMELSPHQKITVSVGVAEYTPGVDVSEMMGRSDKALYHAKEEGRNRVVVYEN